MAAHDPALIAANIADIRRMAAEYGRDPSNLKFLSMFCPVLGKTEEEAKAKYEDYLSYASEEGFFALFGGWTGINMDTYGDEDELEYVESNAMRSAVRAWTDRTPGVPTWTKHTLAKYHAIGALGARFVGSPSQVADEMQRWVDVADLDGFNLAYAIFPGSFQDIAELLVPELQARDMFWNDYAVPSGTYRENLYSPGQNQPLDEHIASKYKWRAGVAKEDHSIPE